MSKLIGVSFCGAADSFVDNLYGTGLEFFKDQPRELPHDLAAKFLYHEGQFERANPPKDAKKKAAGDDTNAVLADAAAKQKAKDESLDAVFNAQNQIANMTKAGLIEYALTQYRQTVDPKLKVDAIRAQVSGFVDQFGVL